VQRAATIIAGPRADMEWMKLCGFALAAIGELAYGQNRIVTPLVESRPVSVIGAVNRPVVFQAAGNVTLLDALARAGGLTRQAAGEILLSHPSADGQRGLVRRIPLKGLMDASDPALNVRLTGGEDIRVLEAGPVFIAGSVKKPAAPRPH
jgi:protein involved in polysaccharide export with SLBB domain